MIGKSSIKRFDPVEMEGGIAAHHDRAVEKRKPGRKGQDGCCQKPEEKCFCFSASIRVSG